MSTVFITSAVHNYGYGRFEYIGFCEDFKVVEKGDMAPHYVISCVDDVCQFTEAVI